MEALVDIMTKVLKDEPRGEMRADDGNLVGKKAGREKLFCLVFCPLN